MSLPSGVARLDPALVWRFLKQTLVWTLALATVLFVSAGTVDWPQAWAFLALSGVLGVASGLIIARDNPSLLRERMRGPIQKEQKPWDKVLLVAIIVVCTALPIAAGIDAKRIEYSHMPLWLEALGALLIAVGLYLFHVVMATNAYASTVVRIQGERGHKVISTGPYAYVRHPMYSGVASYFFGIAFLLGSWWAVGIAAIIVLIFAVRAVWEEETLKEELEGYSDYAERVRFRLVPWIW